MTPREQIYQAAGLFVPGIPKQNGEIVKHDPLQRLTREQLITMVHEMQIENRNLKGGICTLDAANEELIEANANQREYIQELQAALERRP